MCLGVGNADLFRLATFFHSGFVKMYGMAEPPVPSALAPRLAKLATAVGFRETLWTEEFTPALKKRVYRACVHDLAKRNI